VTGAPRDPDATGIQPPVASPPEPPEPAAPAAPATPRPPFAHASEAEMARILDFYGVRWEYEPETFPILWNLDGEVVESFAPDFHLPDFDLYLEMTTLRQKLVRKKNRKLRRLRELYPDIRIKLFYARDFRELMLKYGKLALHAALSGTSGQVVPDRPVPGPAEPVDATPAGLPGTAPRAAPNPAGPNPAGPNPAEPQAAPSRKRRRAAVAPTPPIAGTAVELEASR
jgi:hypoxanthine phosphoribosyltransferase